MTFALSGADHRPPSTDHRYAGHRPLITGGAEHRAPIAGTAGTCSVVRGLISYCFAVGLFPRIARP